MERERLEARQGLGGPTRRRRNRRSRRLWKCEKRPWEGQARNSREHWLSFGTFGRKGVLLRMRQAAAKALIVGIGFMRRL